MSLKIIGANKDRTATYDFLLTFIAIRDHGLFPARVSDAPLTGVSLDNGQQMTSRY